MKAIEKVLKFVTEKIAWGAQVALVSCMVLVVADIVKRSLGYGLITGVPEVVELIGAIILSMGIGYLTFLRGHVAVDVLVMRFRPRVQAIFDIITSAISLGLGVLLTRGIIELAMFNQRIGWATGILGIPRHPFQYVVGASLALMCVILIRDIIKAAIMVKTGGGA